MLNKIITIKTVLVKQIETENTIYLKMLII